MLLWFVGMGVVLVWVVFQSPALDVRVVAVGTLLPWLDLVTGGPFALHTLAGSVGLLAVVMLATRGRRLLRRSLLGLPIGTFLHLVLDASWARNELFWWPVLGEGAFDGRLPELDRGLLPAVLLELAGVAALWWASTAFGLDDPDRRRELRDTGRLRPRS
ncbi:MAG TPA: hypothetical protein VHK25_05275 [Acidimicrobiales bacterium]|nr:hypothetical protein [Acidimicrobiales bacterium]